MLADLGPVRIELSLINYHMAGKNMLKFVSLSFSIGLWFLFYFIILGFYYYYYFISFADLTWFQLTKALIDKHLEEKLL